MRKSRIKKNFWFNEEEDTLLKKLSKISGKTQTQVIKKLVTGAEIKEKPPQEFYETMKQLLELRKELKYVRDKSRYIKDLDAKRVARTLDKIDELRMKITEKFLK